MADWGGAKDVHSEPLGSQAPRVITTSIEQITTTVGETSREVESLLVSLTPEYRQQTSRPRTDMKRKDLTCTTRVMMDTRSSVSAMDAVNNSRAPLTPQSSQGGDNTNSTLNKSEIPLPVDLRRILKEVARTGACSWLPWDQDHMKEQTIAAEPTASAGSSSTGNKAMLGTSLSTSAQSLTRQPFSTHRRTTATSSFSASLAQAAPRKKHRTILHKAKRRKFINSDGTSKHGGNRKRPLLLIRTHPNTTANASAFSAPGSAGSGRTSGSEQEDSTQYECDSEGTSTTTNSEVSLERMRRNQQRLSLNALQSSNRLGGNTSMSKDQLVSQSQKTLQEAIRMAVSIVLDHFYRNRGGYKLSPAEKRRNETLFANNADNVSGSPPKEHPLSPKDIFLQRRQKLVDMLMPKSSVIDDMAAQKSHDTDTGPPFTIQRIAEVLVAPDRYYTQTHKLCNCLEKLLLVTSSTGAFGGSTGGDTSQSRREEREMAALADERGRQESELRQRRMRRRAISPSEDIPTEGNNTDMVQRSNGNLKDDLYSAKNRSNCSAEAKNNGDDGDAFSSSGQNTQGSREMLEAAARASLRTKFDHVGIDPHSTADRDVRSIAENRGMTNSPPPPSLGLSAAPSNMGHGVVSGFVRHHGSDQTNDHHSMARAPSPILFPPNESSLHSTANLQPGANMHMLQLHHAVALAGVSLGRGPPSSLELMTMDVGSGVSNRQHGGTAEGADLDVLEHGRSSASNSDVDSESDDISLDDSASDRSDGSDSGSGTHYEPFTAARAMALNRMQQQQRLQSRVLTSLNSLHQSEGFRPPADSEYQSGDSIDSMRAEDSGGSDSSSQSSDLAD